MYDETYAPVHCNWCGWSGDEADLDMNEHDEPTYCPVCVDIRTVLLTVEKMCLYYRPVAPAQLSL